MKTTNKIKRIVLALAGVGLASLPIQVLANPDGGNVATGSVTIVQETATKLGINQTSNKAIIDWRSFSIGANEQVQFYQVSANSVALNRVIGEDPSKILGRLTANGQVFLVNPNGIYFGKNAQIDVAGLVASTHNIKNEDFLAGKYLFNIPGKPGAAVINEGTIRIADTGIAAFVAPSVANRGVIVAKLGKVALAAANGFTLDFTGDELLTFLVSDEVAKTAFDIEGKPLTSFVENAGKIEAQGGYVLLTAKAAENAIQGVISQSGVIEATSVGEKNGEIILSGGLRGVVSNSGTLDASGKGQGETGGVVQITGEEINLLGGTRIDVSGDHGGGKVIIGGDYLGGKATDDQMADLGIQRESKAIQTAAYTNMSSDAVITADAITAGKGGKVVLWSDNKTQAHGTISAKGGKNGGDGGVIETSGKDSVNFSGARVEASAAAGKAGTWLLDPTDLTIDASMATSIQNTLNSGTNSFITASNSVFLITNINKTSGGDARFNIFSPFIYQFEGTTVRSSSGRLDVDYEATDRVWIGRGYISGGEANIFSNGGTITFHGPNFVGVNGMINAGKGDIYIRSENNNPVGVDKGVWIFGNTTLIGYNIIMDTAAGRRIDAGTSQIMEKSSDYLSQINLSTQTESSTAFRSLPTTGLSIDEARTALAFIKDTEYVDAVISILDQVRSLVDIGDIQNEDEYVAAVDKSAQRLFGEVGAGAAGTAAVITGVGVPVTGLAIVGGGIVGDRAYQKLRPSLEIVARWYYKASQDAIVALMCFDCFNGNATKIPRVPKSVTSGQGQPTADF